MDKKETFAEKQEKEMKKCAADYLERGMRSMATASGVMGSFAYAVATFIAVYVDKEYDEESLNDFFDDVREKLQYLRSKEEEQACVSE